MLQTFILVLEKSPETRARFVEILSAEGYEVTPVDELDRARELMKGQSFNIVLADVAAAADCRSMLEEFRHLDDQAHIITTATFSDIDTAADSLKMGAHDYISKPFDPGDLLNCVKKHVDRQLLQAENKQLYETIKALAAALDARDHYTHGHSRQVTDYAVAIAGMLKMNKREIDNIRDAGLLHDIGKIGISDAVLLKPGPLTPQEYDLIKQHPDIGKKILEPVNSLSDKIPLIYHHHERYDGQGYPSGLKGEDIPLGARILSVADVYQAMTSDRPYRKALSRQIAVEELIKNKGKQFDPRLVEIFVGLLDERFPEINIQ